MPYITATIIVQLLTVVIPRFEALKKEGQAGQTKMTQYSALPDHRSGDPAVGHAHHLRAATRRSSSAPTAPRSSPTLNVSTILIMVLTHDRRHRRDHVAG
jgi:preprotein translocase subunit SecY